MKQRGGIGIEDGWVNEGLSGQAAATLGIGESQELVQFLAGFEGVGGRGNRETESEG
jgi:hypothetical protein